MACLAPLSEFIRQIWSPLLTLDFLSSLQAETFVSELPQSPIATRTASGPYVPLAYKSDICRTYWIDGDCPFRSRCFFVHPPPWSHHTIARDTVAALEDPASSLLQKYQNAQNLLHLQNLQQAGVDVVASSSVMSEPTIAEILEQVQVGSTSGYAVMPLANNSMVPMYPLQPFANDCISSVSLDRSNTVDNTHLRAPRLRKDTLSACQFPIRTSITRDSTSCRQRLLPNCLPRKKSLLICPERRRRNEDCLHQAARCARTMGVVSLLRDP